MAEGNGSVETQAQDRQISVNAQYVKDLSFENPKSPGSLMPSQQRPNIDISIDVNAGPVGEDVFEVALTVSVHAKRAPEEGKEPEDFFVVELSYAGIFTLKNVPDEEREPALLVFCPTLLFPFARRVIADITRDGGFPPLMLDPIDFSRLYAQRKEAEAQGGEAKAS